MALTLEFMPPTAMTSYLVPWYEESHGVVMNMHWRSHGTAMGLALLSHEHCWLAVSWHGHYGGYGHRNAWELIKRAMHRQCHGRAMAVLWQCHGNATWQFHMPVPCNCQTLLLFPLPSDNKVSEKEIKTNKKCSGGGAHGGCFNDLEICEINFFSGYMAWTCWDFLTIFHNKFRASCGRPQCVLHLSPRPAPPDPQSLSHNPHRHRSPSRRPARGCVSYFLCPA